jgi:hypothetical protein
MKIGIQYGHAFTPDGSGPPIGVRAVRTWGFPNVELAKRPVLWEIPRMETAKIDDRRRVRLPHGKPGQVLSIQDNGDGSFTLTPVKADTKEAFPRGSLKYLCTPARNRELEKIASGTIIGVPKDHEQ